MDLNSVLISKIFMSVTVQGVTARAVSKTLGVPKNLVNQGFYSLAEEGKIKKDKNSTPPHWCRITCPHCKSLI